MLFEMWQSIDGSSENPEIKVWIKLSLIHLA